MWDFLMFLMGLSIWDWVFYILSSIGIVGGLWLCGELTIRIGVKILEDKPLIPPRDDDGFLNDER